MTPKRYHKVQDEPNLVRDTLSNAVLNVDATQLQQHRAKRLRMKSKGDEINSLREEVKYLREMIEKVLDANNTEK